MIKRPVRWRRLGAATLASVSIALTALAAQVSPPNADTPAPTASAPAKAERKEVKLPASTLDRYVGNYKFQQGQIMNVTREGTALKAQLTGQPAVEIYPESETAFFYKIVDAQVDFASDGSSLTLHQSGSSFTMPRIDEGTKAQIQAEMQARVASNTPAPGSEAAVRKMAAALTAGNPNYEDMEPALAEATRSQMPHLGPGIKSLGAIQSVEFQRVGDGGWDVYRVKYANGALMWRIGLAENGKVSYALILPDA